MKELLENLLKLTEDEFEDIFQPYSKEEFIQKRLANMNLTKNDDGTYSTDGNVDLRNLGLEKLPVKFKFVGGQFNCHGNNLTTLEGCPEKVGKIFYCSYCKLTTLEGAPKEVGGDFFCGGNKLTTLEGAPEKVGGGFYCSWNYLSSYKLKQTIKRDYLN